MISMIKLNREKWFEIIAVADRDDIIRLGKVIEKDNEIKVLTLENVLLPIKAIDSAKGVEFCLGDVFATECKVLVNGHEGYMLVLGDDKEKAYYGAILDGYFETSNNKQWLIEELKKMENKWKKTVAEEMTKVYETKVEFEIID